MWLQQVPRQPCAFQKLHLRLTLAGLKQLVANGKSRREPFTLEMLRRMASDMDQPPTLTKCTFMAMCCLVFAAFLRYM